MKTYKVAVTWEVCGETEIEANSLEEACIKVSTDEDIPLPKANYVDGSFKVDRGMSRYLNEGDFFGDQPTNMEGI